jgi:hypothetical protein
MRRNEKNRRALFLLFHVDGRFPDVDNMRM